MEDIINRFDPERESDKAFYKQCSKLEKVEPDYCLTKSTRDSQGNIFDSNGNKIAGIAELAFCTDEDFATYPKPGKRIEFTQEVIANNGLT